MKILCCLKHAPDSTARISIAESGKDIQREGIDFNPSPFDEYGIEAAMQIKDANKDGTEVLILCLGPETAQHSIRKALAMGADRAIHLKVEHPIDSHATARALSDAIKDESPDIILFGHQAIDTNAGQVPAYVSHTLQLPLTTVVTQLEVSDNTVICYRQIEGANEVVKSTLPAAFSCSKGSKEPRFPSLPGIMKAKKKPLDSIEVNPIENKLILESTYLPPKREAGAFIGEGVEAVDELINRLRNEAKVI